jgi:hypothetical protein
MIYKRAVIMDHHTATLCTEVIQLVSFARPSSSTRYNGNTCLLPQNSLVQQVFPRFYISDPINCFPSLPIFDMVINSGILESTPSFGCIPKHTDIISLHKIGFQNNFITRGMS